MSNKNNKNLSLVTLFMLLFASIASPARVLSSTQIDTSLTIRTGNAPMVRAVWETNYNAANAYLGTDDSNLVGAQFTPAEIYPAEKNIAICAVISDPDGVSDIQNVTAKVFYPTSVALDPDLQSGCGRLYSTLTLSKLDAADDNNLLCSEVRWGNSNLPAFNTVPDLYDYDDYCAASGHLATQMAATYCGQLTLTHEIPAGSYRAVVTVDDISGLTGTMENQLTYSALTAFETDFSSLNYGEIGLNTDTTVSGDTIFNDNFPSVRNLGNTRLDLAVLQTDMGLGKIDNNWNVRFGSKLGNASAFTRFYPDTATTVAGTINPYSLDGMYFSIEVFDTPDDAADNIYEGSMTLSGLFHDYQSCS